MDSQKFVRDLGVEVGAPSRAALAAARAQLMVEIEREAAEPRPVDIATRAPKRREIKDSAGLAPITALEPRASRTRQVGRVVLAAAAVAAVVAAAIGGVQLLSGLKPEDRTAGPVDPAFDPDGTYLKVTQTRESVWTWSDDTQEVGYGWGDGPWSKGPGTDPWPDATSGYVLESAATVERPRDPSDAPWRVTQGEPCTITTSVGAVSDSGPSAVAETCSEEIGPAGDRRAGEGSSDPRWLAPDDGSLLWAHGTYGSMPDDLPRDPAALRDRLAFNTASVWGNAPFIMSVGWNATRELSWNVLPEDLRRAFLEVLAELPGADVERRDGEIVKIDVAERLNDDAYEQRYVVTHDPALGTVDTVTTLRSLAWEPSGIALDLPDGGAWGARVTTTAIPIDPPEQASPAPTEEPTEEPVEPTADLSTWQITDDGIGPFTIGMPWADAIAEATEFGGDTSAAGAAGSCGVVWVAKGEVMVNAYSNDGATVSAVRTEYSGPNGPATLAPSTEGGLTLLSRIDDVRAAYPDAIEGGNDLVGAFLTVAGGANRIHFGYATEDGGDITSAGDVFAIEVNQLDVLPYEHCDGGGSEGAGEGEGETGSAAPADWEITPTGIGPIELGGSLAAVTSQLGGEFHPEHGISAECDVTYVSLPSGGSVNVWAEGGDVIRSIIFSSGDARPQPSPDAPHTAGGITVGTDLAAVEQAGYELTADHVAGPDLASAWTWADGSHVVTFTGGGQSQGDDTYVRSISVFDDADGDGYGACMGE